MYRVIFLFLAVFSLSVVSCGDEDVDDLLGGGEDDLLCDVDSSGLSGRWGEQVFDQTHGYIYDKIVEFDCDSFYIYHENFQLSPENVAFFGHEYYSAKAYLSFNWGPDHDPPYFGSPDGGGPSGVSPYYLHFMINGDTLCLDPFPFFASPFYYVRFE